MTVGALDLGQDRVAYLIRRNRREAFMVGTAKHVCISL